jgi:hypothetical protein
VANHLSRWLQYEAKDKGKMPADAILPNAEYTEARVSDYDDHTYRYLGPSSMLILV